jgi:SAM-dependent methyltransferase
MNRGSRTVGRIGTMRRDILRKVRQVGMLQTLKHGTSKVIREFRGRIALEDRSQSDPFDSNYGTDTAGIVSVGALDIPNYKLQDTNRYQTVEPETFCGMIRELPTALEEFVFVDVGSGKGRTLLLASCFPFIEIVGVEISAALTRIALNNIRVFRDEMQKCHKIGVVCGDATDYELPLRKTVLYLYNPFGDQSMRAFISRAENSIRDHPRKMFALYQSPSHRILWDQSEAFRVVRTTETYVIYENR